MSTELKLGLGYEILEFPSPMRIEASVDEVTFDHELQVNKFPSPMRIDACVDSLFSLILTKNLLSFHPR